MIAAQNGAGALLICVLGSTLSGYSATAVVCPRDNKQISKAPAPGDALQSWRGVTRYGYFFTLGALVLVGFGLYRLFRRLRWVGAAQSPRRK